MRISFMAHVKGDGVVYDCASVGPTASPSWITTPVSLLTMQWIRHFSEAVRQPAHSGVECIADKL